MNCPFCQKEIPDNSLYCRHCGKKIRRCPTCGMAVQEGTNFCVNDGTRIPDEIIVTSSGDASESAPPKKITSKRLLIVQIALIAVIVVIFSILAVRWFSHKADTSQNSIFSNKDDTENAEHDEGFPYTASPEEDILSAGNDVTADTQEITQPTEPVVTYEYYYEIIQSDMSWTEAKAACEARGGYLATITSVEEYNEICQLADETDLIYLWLGACLPNKNASWSEAGWITGESWSFENWYPGEPSKQDTDGTVETYLCMWTVKDGPWTFNDQRDDIVDALPSITGRVGYVCEYKIEVIE